MSNFIGHIKKTEEDNSPVIQTLSDHLLNTQKYGDNYGSDLELSHVVGLAGLLHDLGKYEPSFQDYIRTAANNPGKAKRGSVDHSSLGGMFLRQYIQVLINDSNLNQGYLRSFGDILENVIFSHHNSLGLKDYINPDFESPFLKRIDKFNDDKINQEDIDNATNLFFEEVCSKKEFDLYFEKAFMEYRRYFDLFSSDQDTFLQNQYFLSQYIYSCLLDADRTDAAAFNLDSKPQFDDNKNIFEKYYANLLDKLQKLNSGNISKINKLRAQISDECDKAAEKCDGIYTLSASTGAGKTLASLRYGLKHANKYHKKHIIFVLPYITIIEQNAQVLRDYLNNDKNDSANILEFHSNVAQDLKAKDDEQSNVLNLAEDNWDAPIIITTMVQFLNSVYASSTKNRRRFHNLCDSVIIFDEVQKVPTRCLLMFNEVVNFLKHYGKSDILLCTATQPALDQIEKGLDINDDHEIISDLATHEQQFKRVEFIDKTHQDNGQDLICNLQQAANMIFSKAQKFKTILGIFNTIKATAIVYQNIKQLVQEHNLNIAVYYLSTNMCPADRKDRIEEVLALAKKTQPVICISTPLIEAGVDASFECVFRSLTGLDSIVQAAGRCNRNNELDQGKVYLLNMNSNEENIKKLVDVKEGKDQVIELLSEGIPADDFLKASVIRKYFERFLNSDKVKNREGYLINHIELVNCIDGMIPNNKNPSFDLNRLTQFSGSETIARYFRVIGNDTVSVLAPYKEGKALIAKLNGDNDNLEELFATLKEAQAYIVNLYQNRFNELFKSGSIFIVRQIGNSVIYAFRSKAYQELVLGNNDIEASQYLF